MNLRDREWMYFDDAAGKWDERGLSLSDLDALHARKAISDDTEIINKNDLRRRGPRARPIRYGSLARLNIEFTPPLGDLGDWVPDLPFVPFRREKPQLRQLAPAKSGMAC